MSTTSIVKTIKPLVLFAMVFCFCSATFGQTTEIVNLKKQLKTTADSAKYVALLNKIGFLMHMKSADSCFYYGIKANEIALRHNYLPEKADALANIGIGLALKGLYSQSLTYYSKALDAYKKAGQAIEVSQMLMNSAITYSFIGDSVKTLQFVKRAVNAIHNEKPDSLVSMIYANYANLNTTLSADSVVYYLGRSKQIATRFKDERALLYLDQLNADKLLQKGKTDKALPSILHSIKLANSRNWEYHALESINMYAQYYLAKKNIDSAIAKYYTVYNVANANGFMYWQTEVLKSLLHCYELKNDVAGQARINKLLVSSLEASNKQSNTFLGDYIAYDNAQQELLELELLNKNSAIKIWLLVVLSLIGLTFTILILRMYSKSRKDASTLSALNEKIGRQNDELHQTDEFKGRLISMLAHDFRAPLASTISMIHLLKDDEDELEKAELANLYDLIEADIQNILLTFDNILQWIRKQLSGYVYNPQTLSITELVNNASSMFKANMDVKKITFVNDVPEGLTCISDKEILQFINRNLIHNALKFSPTNGTITVNAEVLNNEIVVSVKDEGPGISEAKLKTLFSFTNDQKNDSLDKGAGIALNISKEFINKINGKLWAESKERKGTTFFYSLPINAGK